MSATNGYRFLEPRSGSKYKSLFIKGTRIRAVVAANAIRPVPDEDYFPTVEEVARDLQIPVEAIEESVSYASSNPKELKYDSRFEELLSEATGESHPDFLSDPKKYYRSLDNDDFQRIDDQLKKEFGPR